MQQFSAYWRDKHGPIAAGAANLREYWQNVISDRLQRGIDFARGPWELDGVSQLVFDETPLADRAFRQGERAAALIEDESRFLGGLHIVTVAPSVVVAVPEERRAKLLKRISLLKRRPDVSLEDFSREWQIHAEYVRRMPGVAGYRQNIIVAREFTKGTACSYEQLPLDGVVELWFEDTRALEAAFASRSGRATMSHARSFLAEITAFLAEERRIV